MSELWTPNPNATDIPPLLLLLLTALSIAQKRMAGPGCESLILHQPEALLPELTHLKSWFDWCCQLLIQWPIKVTLKFVHRWRGRSCPVQSFSSSSERNAIWRAIVLRNGSCHSKIWNGTWNPLLGFGKQCTGLSEKKAAKLSEFSLNFPKLADWLCMGWSVCQAGAKAGNSNRGKFLCTSLYRDRLKSWCMVWWNLFLPLLS